MEYKYKQLEEELSGLSKLIADLGTRLSEAGKEVTASAVLPSDKLVEQIAASRASFESARTKVHGHAAAMLVSPLPKQDEMTSIAAIGSLLKGAAAAEENKYSTEGERDQALKALARALSLAHREVAEFKPLQECQAKLSELRKAILNVTWPHRHPESEPLAESRHPACALVHFVENLDTIEDEQWIALEATIAGAYGKPLFVAATRGKIEIRGVEPKVESKVDAKPAEPPKPVPAPPKPAPAAEKPIESKPVVVEEKVPEKPAVAPAPVAPVATAPAPAPVTKKIVIPAASAAPPAPAPVVAPAPVAVAEKKEAAQEKAPEKAAPAPVVVAPVIPAPLSAPPVVSATPSPEPAPKVIAAEKKEAADKPHLVLSPTAAPVPAMSVPPVAHTAPVIVTAPAATATSPAQRTATSVAAPVEIPSAPARPTSSPAAAAATPAPTPAAPPIPVAAAPANATLHSLSALASATEPPAEKKTAGPVPIEAVDSSRREARLSTPAPQPVHNGESATNGVAADEEQKTGEGDGQRPQRWGFWRGNR